MFFLSVVAAGWVYLTVSADVDADRGLAVAPLLGAGAGVSVLLAGELTWPRPSGPVRTAILRPAAQSSTWVPGWVVVGAGSAATLAGLLLWLAPQGDPSGRRYSTEDAWTSGQAFPGWFYSVPQLAALALTLVLVLVLVRSGWLRPAVVSADPATDLRLRRASTSRALRLLAAACLLVIAGDLYVASNAFGYSAQSATAASLAEVLALLCAASGALVLLVPVPRLKSTDVVASAADEMGRDAVDHR